MLAALVVEETVLRIEAYAQDPVVEAALACFEESRRVGENSSECDRGVISVEAIMLRPTVVPSATVEAVLDGLERLALGSDSKRARISAAGWLTAAGEPDGGTEDPGRA